MRPNNSRAKTLDPEPPSEAAVEAGRDERRADPRRPVDEPATIKVLNPLQSASPFPARIVEMSRGGMKVRLKQSLMPGTLVQIRFKGKLAMGEIRYTERSGSDYYTGVRLQDVLDTSLR